jgi:hypothetical protein
VRDLPIVIGIALAVTSFWLRSVLALLDVADWLSAWRLVNALTAPVISFLQILPWLERTITGHLTLADICATAAVTLGAFLALASLSIRRAST